MPDNRLPDNRLTMANAHVQTWEKPADGPPKITRTHPVSGAFPEASPEAVKIRLLATWLSDQIEQIAIADANKEAAQVKAKAKQLADDIVAGKVRIEIIGQTQVIDAPNI
jgi:hypothetical protein